MFKEYFFHFLGLFIVYLLTLFLIRWVLLLKKRNSSSSVAWIIVIGLVPVLGGFFFLLFGINRVERRKQARTQATLQIRRNLPDLTSYQVLQGEFSEPQLARLARLANRLGDNTPLSGNQVELLTDTNRAMGLIIQAIKEAKESVHLEYYIWRSDKIGTELGDLLMEKAKEGVKIRFIYDGFGSMFLGKKFLNELVASGVSVAAFLQGASLRERWSINLRNHRKIIVVDGRVGFTGGMNIADEYLGRDSKLGYWRDTHMKLTGPCVTQLQRIFVEDWLFSTEQDLTEQPIFPQPLETGTLTTQILAGGPSGDYDEFHSLMFSAINEARNEILLTTSFFVPTDPLATALENAALRGVRVRLLVNGKAMHPFTVWAGRSYYDGLLNAGVEIYEYREGMLHSKTLTIDGHWSLVGSPNFDARSLFLNFEDAAILYDKRSASHLTEHFTEDLTKAVRIEADSWKERPVKQRLKENFCRLFAPVL